MKKITIVYTTGIIMIFSLIFTFFIVINDISRTLQRHEIDLTTPENTIKTLEYGLKESSFIVLDEVFKENHYSIIFGDLFFNKNISAWYGYSNDPKINRVKTISSKDIFRIQKNNLNYLSENDAIGILVIEENNPNYKNYFTSVFLMQKLDNEWKITKFYDFAYLNSEFLEVKDFILHHINNEFRLRLAKKNIPGTSETTLLYNFALSLESVTLSYNNELLCNISNENIKIFINDNEIELNEYELKNPNTLLIEDECNFDDIITRDRERKYRIEIMLNTKFQEIPITYYGDLIQ